MSDKKIITGEHHRRPRSLGGKSNEANIYYVRKLPHRHYHTLFGNMNAYQICDWLNNSKFIPNNLYITCKFINGCKVVKSGSNCSKKDSKINNAWNSLMKGLTFKESIEYINNVWLDPSYHLYIHKNKE